MKKKQTKQDLVANDNSLTDLEDYKVITISPLSKPYFQGYRYIIEVGGRGSGKSFRVSEAAILRAYQSKILMLCGRFTLESLGDSVHSELCARISDLGLDKEFIIKKTEIICKHNGSRIFFKGLDKSKESLKSIANVDILWIEEADKITKEAWNIIKPTIRKKGSQIWVSFNPRHSDDVIYNEFLVNEPPANAYVKKSHWSENLHLSEEFHADRLQMLKTDPTLYAYIYDGQLLANSEAQIFYGKWQVEEFEDDRNVIAYYGLDFGYGVDPTAAIRCYIKDDNLYITHEAGKTKLEIDHIGEYCSERLPLFNRSRIYADSARPDTISYLKRQGYRVEGADKGKGSIEDGIAFIRSFNKVIIHPRCTETIKEFTLYSYVIDKRTDEITTKIEDKHNHYIDALRYSLRKMMNKRLADYKLLTKNM